MKNKMRIFLLCMLTALISACGGSSGGATGPTLPQNQALSFAFLPIETSLPANTLGYAHYLGNPFITQVDVRITYPNGQIVPDGTTVNFSTSNGEVAYVFRPDDPATTNVNEFIGSFATITNTTQGGRAIFYVGTTANPGSVTLTASAVNPQNNRSYSGNLAFTVTTGPAPIDRLVLTPQRTKVPANVSGVAYFAGTPFVTELNVSFRDAFGNVANPGETATVSISPSSSLLFSRRDDLSTANVNEFLAVSSQGTIPMSAGSGTIFLWSQSQAGTAEVSVSVVEEASMATFTSSVSIEVVNDGSTPQIPTSVSLNTSGSIYINGSGGSSSQGITVLVNGGNSPVADASSNNVQLKIATSGSNSGEKLVGKNSTGSSVEGSSIEISTLNGVANATLLSGTLPNTVTLTATVDRADNNVSNGIQDPLITSKIIIVGDGVLSALELTTPALDALTVNGDTTTDSMGNISYNFQDGTYSLVMNVIGTDKSGNPALPQSVQFGLVDSPIVGFPTNGSGTFAISGADGDPLEGGSTFTSAQSNFLTNGGGVNIGDTLLVFGEETNANEDLESANIISAVNSSNQVTINGNFNRNDGTGNINNDLGVLPFIIGRAVDGNIEATATIGDNGVGTTRVNYAVSQLGRIAAVYAKAQGGVVNSVVKTVADVEVLAYPGIEGFRGQSSTLTVSPSVIPGNRSFPFTVCLADSARNPLQGRSISFSYNGNGLGTIDGQAGSGVMSSRTGTNGCANGVASTSGVVPGSGNDSNGGFNFISGNLTCDTSSNNQAYCLVVESSANGVLNANPSSFIGSGEVEITLSLFDGSGNAIQNAAIQGSCGQVSGGSLGIISGPDNTDSNGQSTVTVTVALDGPEGGLSGTCTFQTATGSPSVTVNFSGGDSCALLAPSPAPPVGACTPPTP